LIAHVQLISQISIRIMASVRASETGKPKNQTTFDCLNLTPVWVDCIIIPLFVSVDFLQIIIIILKL
jgi:hypothetical protein